MNSFDRGWLEFFREIPGLILVFVLALMHKISDWKIMRIGTMISMVGISLILIPADKMFITLFIMVWSMGEHLVLPIRNSIAMQVAKPEHAGQSLGYLSSVQNFGAVAGSIIVSLVFYIGTRYYHAEEHFLFTIIWILILFLMCVSLCSTFTKNAPNTPSKRPRLYYHAKFSKFYILELFYGARKQIFLTFAPFVLIKEYNFDTASVALIVAACAAVNIFAAPLLGKISDRWGYRNVMIWDTIILFFVCLLYGYAKDVFPASIALVVVCINFLMDAVISTASLATNMYVREIAHDRDELTSTLSTGISINHLIAIIAAPLGGWVWHKYGIGTLFTFAAVMSLANSAFAYTVPKNVGTQKENLS